MTTFLGSILCWPKFVLPGLLCHLLLILCPSLLVFVSISSWFSKVPFRLCNMPALYFAFESFYYLQNTTIISWNSHKVYIWVYSIKLHKTQEKLQIKFYSSMQVTRPHWNTYFPPVIYYIIFRKILIEAALSLRPLALWLMVLLTPAPPSSPGAPCIWALLSSSSHGPESLCVAFSAGQALLWAPPPPLYKAVPPL